MNNNKKKIKSLISNLLAGNTQNIDNLTRELSESILIDKEDDLMKILTESFKGETNV
jgi:hypothetical protein